MYPFFRCRLPVGFNKNLHCHRAKFHSATDATMQSLQQQREQIEIGANPPKPRQLTVTADELKVQVCEDPKKRLLFFFFFGGLLGDDL